MQASGKLEGERRDTLPCWAGELLARQQIPRMQWSFLISSALLDTCSNRDELYLGLHTQGQPRQPDIMQTSENVAKMRGSSRKHGLVKKPSANAHTKQRLGSKRVSTSTGWLEWNTSNGAATHSGQSWHFVGPRWYATLISIFNYKRGQKSSWGRRASSGF